jgi:murein L,D-transpeptidase YafK
MTTDRKFYILIFIVFVMGNRKVGRRNFLKIICCGVAFLSIPKFLNDNSSQGSLQENKSKIKNLENELKSQKLHEVYGSPPQNLEKYNQWIDSTLAESAQTNKNSIIVDKSAYTLYLIKQGNVDSQYNIELGFNPVDDKKVEGDKCTPEGMYFVSWKADKGQTAFHRGFLINYPNEEDRKNSKTGGEIMIHGSGSGEKGDGKGYNWTLGCVALSNKDIDKIFPYINTGDRVTIVKYTDRDLRIENKFEK